MARVDLANEDLIRSHLHAVWLGETRQKLGPSVQDVLDREIDTHDPYEGEVMVWQR